MSRSLHKLLAGSCRRARLEVETLDNRITPTVTFHGGALLPHVEVQALFLGADWVRSPTYLQQARTLSTFLHDLVTGPYLDLLATAGYNVGRGTASSAVFDPISLDKSAVLTDAAIQADLQLAITAGLLKGPDANRLYVVFVEDNVSIGTGDGLVSRNDFLGYHGAFTGRDATAHVTDIRYAALPYPGGSIGNLAVSGVSVLQSLTVVASHEVAEAVTDPDVNYAALGWYDDVADEEVGDVVNQEYITLGGYAVQRVADKHDNGMTPVTAAPLQPVCFEMLTNGKLYEHAGNSWTFVHDGVTSLSSQGIDDNGRAMVDLVLTNGDAYEYHDGGVWQFLDHHVKAASAGQGVSYVLLASGALYEYFDDSGTWSRALAGHIAAIDAGTDRYGVNMVDVITTSGTFSEYSDSTGCHSLCGGARSVSAGRNGTSVVVLTDGRAFAYTETTGKWMFLGSKVVQAAAGTDSNGDAMFDLVLTTGTALEYRATTGLKTLSTAVAFVGKARAGLADVVYTNGIASEHTTRGWTALTSTVRQAA
jgi:hypothetical protein